MLRKRLGRCEGHRLWRSTGHFWRTPQGARGAKPAGRSRGHNCNFERKSNEKANQFHLCGQMDIRPLTPLAKAVDLHPHNKCVATPPLRPCLARLVMQGYEEWIFVP